ncbi:tetratricopeptide repeat protein [Stutzerimonas azotifigens]|uniref:tetratricopeptide repeat protein n=1 Tax=Stutzerimonas azotifigens TaxID=291995 RepID=UPI001F37FB9F|nr:sel1 repeat family protein [Stutzerimonas azotifigens]
MRSLTSKSPAKYPTTSVLPLRVARWLLDSETLARTDSAKRIAGRLLKQPAREGVVEAQSRLGRLLCKECDSQRDRRIGLEMLRQAARAGDCQAQLALGRLYSEARHHEPTQARHWLEQAAAQGSQEARHLLQRQRVRA